MTTVRVSIIVPAYNAARYIADTLDSIRAQQGVDTEVIVVDDGSTDGTAERALAADPRITLLRQERAGVSAARQAGTRVAKGCYLKYVDADDLLTPGGLIEQLGRIERSGADVVYGAWAYLERGSDADHYRQGKVMRPDAGESVDEAVMRGFWCPTAAYLIRRDRLNESGVVWSDEFPILQDSVFIFDLAAAGATFEGCPEVCALYRVHADSLSRSDRRGFMRDKWRHLERARAVWGGRMSPMRTETLCAGYVSIALEACRLEPELSAKALQALRRLDPTYLPNGSPRLSGLARWIGLDRAIRWTSFLRR